MLWAHLASTRATVESALVHELVTAWSTAETGNAEAAATKRTQRRW